MTKSIYAKALEISREKDVNYPIVQSLSLEEEVVEEEVVEEELSSLIKKAVKTLALEENSIDEQITNLLE